MKPVPPRIGILMGFTDCGSDENRVTLSTEAREVERNPKAPLASAVSLRNFLRSIGIGWARHCILTDASTVQTVGDIHSTR